MTEGTSIIESEQHLAGYAQVTRELPATDRELRAIRVSLLASFTIDPLLPFLKVEAAEQGFGVNVHTAAINTFRQQLIDPNSDCIGHDTEIVFLAPLLRDVCPWLEEDFLSLSASQVEAHSAEVVEDLISCLRTFRTHSQADIVLHNFNLPARPLLGIHEPASKQSQTEAIRQLNRRLADAATDLPGVYLLDFDRLCADVGYQRWENCKAWHLGRAPLATETLRELSKCYAAFLNSIQGSPRKCLVLDLDNTLWGGVLGEDGISGIKLGHTYPANIFRTVQREILQLQRRGVLLAVNSKNNWADVEEVFESHPDMVLKRDHFASLRVNWRSKPKNMLEIADELAIGVDSLVFLDDNPAECELMRQSLPEVLTWQASDGLGRPDPLGALQLLRDSIVFDRLAVTSESQLRGLIYRQQADRETFRKSSQSMNDFLSGLEMRARVSVADDFTFPRIVELLGKTNQFNLTTHRHSAAQIEEFVQRPDCGVFTLQLVDRFGDNGIVGVAIVELHEGTARVDSFLLSCRVIGRTVETAFLSFLIDWARRHGAENIEGEFIPTAKNTPAAGFYADHGFAKIDASDSSTRWRWNTSCALIQWPPYIRKDENGC